MEVWLPVAIASDLLFKVDCVKSIAVHILVAQALIPNPKNKPYVNHINSIRYDNHAERTVFCHNSSKKIMQMTLDGNVVQVWDSAKLAGITLNISSRNIATCCRGKRNSAGRWHWMYYDSYIQSDPNEE
ncbi:hypothetical protein Glove_18g122 [Diversispora epigaea]|uniref:HNH nuclease domain-containing protein n=1 Tax=Diversispora epigaea TaxID=1348612 RepID=A0A397JXK6_9GLOM|nr:hypothetical protein Glove_18g122 [Diversispora epigaea]